MNTYKTTGIILRRHDYAEADRIYTILTPEGKVSAIAKSVRRIRAKLASHLELLTVIDLMLAPGKRLDVITSARITERYELTHDYERLWRGFLYLEMADKLTSEQQTQEVYECLYSGLTALASDAEPVAAELAFKLRLLDALGRRPELNNVLDSGEQPREDIPYGFDRERGGLVASSGSPDRLSPEALKLWRLCLRTDPVQAVRIGGTAGPARESISVCNRFYDYLFDVSFKATEIDAP